MNHTDPPEPACASCNDHGYHEDGFCSCPAGRIYLDKLDDHTARALDALHQAERDAVRGVA